MNIILTKRLYIIFLSALLIVLILPLLFSTLSITALWLVLFTIDLFIFLLLVVDIVLTPNKRALLAQREMDKRFSIGRENQVSITVENLGDKPLYCRLTDDYPQEMNCSNCDFNFVIANREKTTVSYALIPKSKGVYNFGAIYIRVKSQFGLFHRQIEISIPEQIKVYSDIKSLSELSLRLGTATALGEIQRKNKGQGTNFTGLAEYVVGKDVSKIDWNATARAQRPIIREYDREEDQRLLILVDAGRTMFSELDGLSKFDHALNAALSLSLTALTLNDQVGLGIFADGPLAYLPPRRGKAYLQKLLDVSANTSPRLVEPDYLEMLNYFASRQKGRTLFVILTDLVDVLGSRSLLAALASLRQKHLTFCVVFANQKIEKMVEPDKLSEKKSDHYDQYLQRAVATDLLSQRQMALDVLKSRGCLILNAPPEKLSSELIANYLDVKRKALL